MAKIYGTTHALADFVDRLLPRTASGGSANQLELVIDGLKRLDAVQRENPLVTLNVTTGGGIWIIYGGRRYLMIIPAKNWLRIVSDDHDSRLSAVLDRAAARNPAAVKDTTGANDYRQWSVYPEGQETLWRFIERLPKPSVAETAKRTQERRYFSGAIREAALSQFEASGRICPGVDLPGSPIKPHKVAADVRIEFDHILPHSRRGSRGESNCQVLCQNCNRIKAATAY
jgi:hypothetical protein